MAPDDAELTINTNRHRQTHKKSRFGCKNCKARRIKCDEGRPCCANCAIRKKVCDFQPDAPAASPRPLPKVAIAKQHRGNATRLASPASHDSGDSSSHSLVSTMTEHLYLGQEPSSRLLELRLFHHYMLRVSDFRWPSCGPGAFAPNGHLRARSLPMLALESDHLMDAVLSMAALSLYGLNITERSLYVTSQTYMARAITKFRTALSTHANSASAEGLYTTSIVIAIHTLSQHLMDPELLPSPANPMEWLRAFRGLRTISTLTGKKSQFTFLEDGGWHYPYANDTDLSAALDPFGFLLNSSEGLPPAEIQAYQHIVAYLASVYYSSTPNRMQMSWFLVENRGEFLVYCDQGTPMAHLLLGVYLYFVVAFNKVRPLGMIAHQDIKTIVQALNAEDASALAKAGAMIRERFVDDEMDAQDTETGFSEDELSATKPAVAIFGRP